MYSARDLFPGLCDRDALARAAACTVRGKRQRPDVAWFLFRREDALARLHAAMSDGTWAPDGFRVREIRDPKPRVIACASVSDRVVHTALVAQMTPVLTRSLLPDVFACRPGFGTHRAVLRLLALARRHRFAVHLDVKAYFPSVDVDILRGLLARRIRDGRFLAVVDQVLDAGAALYRSWEVRRFARLADDWPPPGRGLPIGALTSQLFAAHLYLDGLDHFVKRTLKVPGYLRYVDDLFCFGDRRADLRRWRADIGRWLAEARGLRLKHPNARVLACAGHLDALGYRIRREGIEALPRVTQRLKRRVRGYLAGPGGGEARRRMERSIASSVAGLFFG